MIAFVTIAIPYKVAFLDNNDFGTASTLIAHLIMLLIFWIDIIVMLRTAYLENEDEIVDANLIFRKRIKSPLFLANVVTSLPIFLVLHLVGVNPSTIKYFLFLHAVRIFLPRKKYHLSMFGTKAILTWQMVSTVLKVFLIVRG